METTKTKGRIAVLLADAFEDSEYKIPTDRLRDAGAKIDVIGTERGKTLKGHKQQVTAKTTKGIDEVAPQDYDLLLIPGGYSPDQLRADRRFVDFVREFDHTGKPVAAVCHGPQLLAAAHLIKGRTLTAWSTVQDDLEQMGANVKDDVVVCDRNWITSRKPEDLDEFSDAILDALSKEPAGPWSEAQAAARERT
jgi:protease I